MEAAEAGQPPERQEFLARYADIAVPLALCLDGLNALRGPLAAGSGDGSTTATGGLEADLPLGDYRLVRELGRGGMGIVYEAEQLSLGRRVALKVLPFAATLDRRHLQRFHNEARAAASLHHANIVPVYGVGSDRGVHYYAMQFIEGQSLAIMLREMRKAQKPAPPSASAPAPADPAATIDQQPARDQCSPHAPREDRGHAERDDYTPIAAPQRETVREPRGQASTMPSPREGAKYFQRVAELTIQAAEALEHAHQSGVVHRDIKPANLLLDERGSLWVTDFGLAQFKSDAHLTMTGDLVGTLRYMSPEQALAQRVIVDHRTDIYSLGATLYELLTLRPAFRGRDRQELLRQIAFEEPIAPRRLNRAIPIELETIAVKAMEKNPADRYGTAKELADDLQRFLKDEPTLARRPTLWRRARKWSRRHVAAIRAATVALVVVLASVTGLAGAWLSDRANREGETQRAVNATLAEADLLQKERKLPEALAKVKQAEAILSSGVPTPALNKSVQARMADLKLVARLEEIKAQLAADVVMLEASFSFDYAQADRSYAQAFQAGGFDLFALPADQAAQRIHQRSVAVELAATLDQWSFVAKKARPADQSRWKQLLAVARAADPDPLRNQLRTALVHKDTNALKAVADRVKGEELPAATVVVFGQALNDSGAGKEAIALLRQGQRRHRTDFWINNNLAERLYHRQPPLYDEAIRFYTAALSIRPDVAGAHAMLGSALYHTGQVDEAIAAHREAIRLKPDFAGFHLNLGFALKKKWQSDYPASNVTLPATNPAIGLKKKEQLEQAMAAFDEAVRLKPDYAQAINALVATLGEKDVPEETRNKYKDASKRQQQTASFHFSRAVVLKNQGKTAEAIESLKKAIEIDPNHSQAHNYLAWQFATAADPKLRDPAMALEHAKTAVDKGPIQTNGLKSGHLFNTLGMALYRNDRWQDAVEKLDLAAQLRTDNQKDTYFFLAMAHWKLGHKDDARTWYDKGLEWHQQNQWRLLLSSDQAYYQSLEFEAGELMGIPAPNPLNKDAPVGENRDIEDSFGRTQAQES